MFEIEHMNETFDYSLVDDETADFLKEREYTINGIAEDARIKIGRELKKAHDKLANHSGGIFERWYTSGGISKDDAYYYMELVELSTAVENRKMDNFLKQNKSLQRETLRKNTPEELKEQVLNGDITTHKEFQELKKQLKQRDEEKTQLESQLEQAQRSESIARKQLEYEQDKEPEVIERYMEPEDYQSIKNMNEHLQSEREYYKKQADGFRDEVKNIMQQTNKPTENNRGDNKEDYTPTLLQLLKPAKEFINYYSHHISKEKALNEIEKIKNILKEQ